MKLTESEQFKIDLVNNLNHQRLNGVNCDIEIISSFDASKIFTHSIILKLFSEMFKSFIGDKMKMMKSMSVCRIVFPDEIKFIRTNCFDCFNQVINYLYTGEINVKPQHEVHVKHIVFNLRMHKLIALLFSSKAWNYEDALTWNDVTKVPSSHDSRTENNISEESPGSSCKRISTLNEQNDCIRNEHLKFCEPDKNCTTKSKTNVNILENIETRDSNSSDRGARIAIQSPLKKRLKFTKDYESVPNNHDDTKTPTSDKDKEVKDQIHSDGLHLLLSILEEENKKALLSEHCTRDTVSNVIVDEKNNFPENKSSTITSQEHKAENCVEGNTKNSTNSIIYQALVSKNENKIDQGSGDNIARTSLEENSNGPHDNLNRKNNGKQRKRKVKNIGENSLKRKSGSLKKKENKGEVIGVQDGYMCNKCKIFFDNLSSFQEHMQSTHSKKFRCIACDFMTIKIRYFIDHLIQNRHDGEYLPS